MPPLMIYSLTADDMPLLSQWIKKSDKSKLVGFFGPPEGILSRCCRTYRLAALVATSVKTVPRTVFFRYAPSLFESLRLIIIKKRQRHLKGAVIVFGPPEGIRTPVLQNRNLLRYPAAPRTDSMTKRRKSVALMYFILHLIFILQVLSRARSCRYPLHCKDPSFLSSVQFCRGVLRQDLC